MDDLTRMIETEAIKTLMAKRVRCIDEKDWDGLASVYSDDCISWSFGAAEGKSEPTIGGKAIAEATAKVLTGLKTVHQVHFPEIKFQSDTEATGIWPLHDVVGISRPQADNRGIVMVEPPALLVPLRELKTFLAPDPLDLLVVHAPAFGA